MLGLVNEQTRKLAGRFALHSAVQQPTSGLVEYWNLCNIIGAQAASHRLRRTSSAVLLLNFRETHKPPVRLALKVASTVG